MDEKQFQDISSKLDTIIKLLALNSVQGKDPKRMVLVLSSLGFQPKQIADILNEKSATIRSRLFRARKETEKVEDSSENKNSSEEGINE